MGIPQRSMCVLFAVSALFAQHEQAAKDKPKHPFIGTRLQSMPVETFSVPDAPDVMDRMAAADEVRICGSAWCGTPTKTTASSRRFATELRMPGSKAPDDDVWRIVAFVRSLTAPAFEMKPAGDVNHGSELFWGSAGCSGCHRIGNRGGFSGPNLSNVGLSSTVPKIHDAIVEPDSEIAEGYQKVSVVLRTGEKFKESPGIAPTIRCSCS